MSYQSIIVMCQGQQRRLPTVKGPKHLIEVDGEPVLARTLRLLAELLPQWDYTVRVVGPEPLAIAFRPGMGYVEHFMLPDPGNCIVDGILAAQPWWAPNDHGVAGRTLVLLGDVVWSKAALGQVLADQRPVVFAGTSVLSPSEGEVFALGFDDSTGMKNLCMTCPCRVDGQRVRAFKMQQGGHLRRLLWHLQDTKFLRMTATRQSWNPTVYLPIDDWTTDLDTPADLERLPLLTRACQLERQAFVPAEVDASAAGVAG